MTLHLKVLTVFFALSFGKVFSQTYVKDSLGVDSNIYMDERTEKLLSDLENKCKNTSSGKTVASTTSGTTTSAGTTTSKAPTNKAELCRQNPKLMGYKILVGVVKSKEEADQLGLSFRSKFPALKVQVDASLRPNYKIMAGSYFSLESIKGDLASVRRSFPGARSVQYQIFCSEAK